LVGALVLVSFFACGNGCVIETRELTIVVTDYVCTKYEEEHYDENYMDPMETVTETFWQDLDDVLAENDMTKDDVEGASVSGVYYRVLEGPTAPPPGYTEWTVSGRILVQLGDDIPVLIARYQSVALTEGMGSPDSDYFRIMTEDAGLDVLDLALEQYLDGGYPEVTFYSDHEVDDIDPSPSGDWPFVMDWEGCLSMRIDFVEEYDVYDMFPAD
jgi:hypothetical protein